MSIEVSTLFLANISNLLRSLIGLCLFLSTALLSRFIFFLSFCPFLPLFLPSFHSFIKYPLHKALGQTLGAPRWSRHRCPSHGQLPPVTRGWSPASPVSFPLRCPTEVIRARRTRAVLRVMMLIRKFVSFKGESSEARKTDFCPPRNEIPH